MTKDILLVAVNARYQHTSFALRYLKANLEELEERCQLLEFTLEERPIDCLEKILALQPRIVGFSVYIWNVQCSHEIIQLLRRVAPDIIIVLGGPEVSYEWQDQGIVALADHLILHEGEAAFRHLAQRILAGEPAGPKVIPGGQPPLELLRLPYRLYSQEDLAHRVIYVEASRGCPFRCEFCLSSLDKSVRYFPMEELLQQLQLLLDRGARQFKFIDRTFNLRIEVSRSLLQFFWERYRDGLFLHFEMVPDRFPPELREWVQRFPPGSIQFEIGIQSFDPPTQQRISRRQDLDRLQDNLEFLRRHSGVHIHADLILGLPGESLEVFARGFDRLVALGPQEIQVGVLKRLRGTPILRHDQEFAMVYSPNPPYEVLSTGAIPFASMMQAKRFARIWDVVANRGRFPQCLPLLLGQSPFQRFWDFSQWLASRLSTRDPGHLRLAELLFDYLLGELGLEVEATALAMLADYTDQGRRNPPGFLHARPELPRSLLKRTGNPASRRSLLPERQARHQENPC